MKTNWWVSLIVGISTIIGTYIGVSSQYLSKAQFDEFKNGTIGSIDKRLDNIDKKLDRILENNRRVAE